MQWFDSIDLLGWMKFFRQLSFQSEGKDSEVIHPGD